MRLFKKVAIIGTGLIGGSIALAIKKNKLAEEVVGVSRHKSSILQAKRMGAICCGSQDLSIIKGAELVIFATPVEVILKLAPAVAGIIGKDCIVSDVGSTKESITKLLGKKFRYFVGAHPLAGSEKRGIKFSEAGLFKGSLCIVTVDKKTDRVALNRIKKLWKNLGARVVVMPASKHDRALSLTSHLPHIAAFSMMNSIPPELLRFSASGLKDSTRIAASDSELWSEIFLNNKNNVLKALKNFKNNLSILERAIRRNDKNRLSFELKKAKAKREKLG